MLTSVMARAGQGVARYTANAVDFDGTNDYLLRGADITGIADGKTGTVSLWIRVDGGDGATQTILTNESSFFIVQRSAANKFRVDGYTSGVVLTLQMLSTTSYTTSATWHHVLMAWDLAAAAAQLYVDNADDLAAGGTANNNAIDYVRAAPDWGIGATLAGANKLNGCVAEFWFTTTYIDISVAANRAKFISQTTLKPVSLGADGSTPTGAAPLIYLANPAASFQTNLGTGGDFSVTGTLTAASTSPSD